MIEMRREKRAAYLRRCRMLVVISGLTAGFYLWWLLLDARPANPVLFTILVAAEIFNVAQAAGFWYTIWIQRWTDPPDADFSLSSESVDAFVTVAGEPADIVERTVRSVAEIRHPRLTVWLLDDKPAPENEAIAARNGARYVTRPDRSGAKAGNINHALALADGDFVIIFDADHAPLPAFLERTMAPFEDAQMAFVQTPQYYSNRASNRAASGAHDQQMLFYGPILRGKNGAGAVFSCGTNVIFRRKALDEVGGMPQDSITEDLRISLMLLRLGWTSVYVPEVLAFGLGPVDVRGYFSQQRRWAGGGFEILLRRHPFSSRMRPPQAIQYALSFMYWFTGWAYAGYVILPIAFLFFGLRPVQVPNQYPIHFLPYVFATLFTMIYATGFTLTFRALWFTLASFPVHFAAFFSSLWNRTSRFVVTSKSVGARSLAPVRVQMATIALLLVAIPVGLIDQGVNPSVMNNVAFALGHILILQGFVRLALNPLSKRKEVAETEVAARDTKIAVPAAGLDRGDE